MNGSSVTGNCATISSGTSSSLTCADPTSSVLFDDPRGMPILTGLDSDMWASQLLTIHKVFSFDEITFKFSDTPGVERVEVVMFNCPDWGIGVQAMTVFGENVEVSPIFVNITSCDSLVSLCLPARITAPVFTLRLASLVTTWLHIAEVTFLDDNPTCPPDIALTAPPTSTEPPPDITTATPHSYSTSQDLPTCSAPTQCEVCLTSDMVSEVCPSSSTSVVLASVITAIITALLATVIFVLVLIAVCKCHPKFTPGGAETGTAVGEGEGQEYERMNTGEGGVAVSGPTYMEVGAFELEQNEAYGITTFKLKQNDAYGTQK